MSHYAVIIEKGEQGFGAYVPDLPGCVATAATREEVTRLIGEAIELHIEDLRRRGEPVPRPKSSATRVEVGR
jgi:predicted RNase H-like HicB family nuclease